MVKNSTRPERLLEQCIERLLQRVLADKPPPLRIGISVQLPDWEHAFHVPPRDPQQNTPAALAAALEAFSEQSGDGIDLFSEQIRFHINAIWPLPVDDAAGSCANNELEARADGTIRCQSYVPVINPGDNYCLARALIFGLADRRLRVLQRQPAEHFRSFCNAQQGAAGTLVARRLLQSAGVALDLPLYGVPEAQCIQRLLDVELGAQQVRIVVLGRQRGCSVIWKSPVRAAFNLFIVADNGHYGYIQKPEQLLHARMYCVECEQKVDRRSHPQGCRAACMQCLRFNGLQFPCRRGAEDPRAGHLCNDCGFVFVNRDCLDAHRRQHDEPDNVAGQMLMVDRRRGRQHRSLCQERHHCPQCNVIVWARAGVHQCRRARRRQDDGAPGGAGMHLDGGTVRRPANNNDDEEQQQQQLPLNPQQQEPICNKCTGPHVIGETPCFIQPNQAARQFQRGRLQQQQQPDGNLDEDEGELEDGIGEAEDDDEDPEAATVRRVKKQKPTRFIFWDAECSQVNEHQQQQQDLAEDFKHVPVLICADVICERCIADGVKLETEPLSKADDCCCGVPWRGGNRARWAMRIGADAFDDQEEGGEEGLLPVVADEQLPPDGRNPRRLHFYADARDEGSTAVVQFVDFLLHTGPMNVCSMLLAHNGGRYDAHLLLEELHRRGINPRRLVSNGLRIYSLNHSGRNQRQFVCKDTLNFFGCALSALPSAFGLAGVVDKPFFPYGYIRRENMDVEIEGLPPRECYEPDQMKEAKRAQFLRWYDTQLQRVPAPHFQLRRELLRYCSNDVRILREASLRFRQIVGQLTGGMEPFLAASTIAGLALAVFRQCHLQRNLMRHTPEGGFLRGRRSSAASRRFFAFLEQRRPEWAPIRTAQWAIGEAGVEDDGYRLDGLVYRPPPLRPIAIEFNGCYFHGCPKCYPNRQMILAAGLSAELLYSRTQRRAWELETQHGMKLFTVWECEFANALRRRVDLRRQYIAATRFVPEPLDLRKHALFGGRVEPFCLNITCPEGWDILLYDIVSQYPDVMKNCSFPLGLPRVLTREHLAGPEAECAPLPWHRPADNPYRGFLLCCVLPPSVMQLGEGRLPLLPHRLLRGCLTFPLCRSCAEQGGQRRRFCRHDDAQKCLVAAYTHAELNKALELGYTVLDLWEVWDYAEWSSTPENGDGAGGGGGVGLFADYIDTFMKLKAEASGWPEECRTAEQRAEFVRQYREREGIQLDPAHVEDNPSLRKIAKSLINSLWGKLAQRAERDEVRYTKTARQFHDLLADPSHEMVCYTHINEHLDRCVVRKRAPFVRAPVTNNLAVACFVTSYARLSLYRRLEEVHAIGGKPTYCDTDSVMFLAPRGAPPIASAGDSLGRMKRELPDRRITDFFAGGPKNYGYRHVNAQTGGDPRAERKIRGLQLNYAAGQLVTFERARQLVLNHFGAGHLRGRTTEEWCITVPYTRFVRNRHSHIFTRHGEKVYKPVYTKGQVLRPENVDELGVSPTIWTRPFGWFQTVDDGQQEEIEEEEEEEEEDSEIDESDDNEYI